MRDDITRMAREAGFNVEQGFLLRVTGINEDLERFFNLAYAAGAAAEREACAKVCYEVFDKTGLWAALQLSDKIRARGNK